jgi:hypothetical protein
MASRPCRGTPALGRRRQWGDRHSAPSVVGPGPERPLSVRVRTDAAGDP